KDPYGIKSSGLFKNTDCYSVLQLSLTYSFMPKCVTCNKDY
ncbi:MAG: porin family protein, partial [Prevotella sp.]|nr:porin family protein [Prevotella sp.]